MLTTEDIKKLKEILATKEDFQDFKAELIEIFPTRDEFNELKESVDSMKKSIDRLISSVDKFAGIAADLKQEYIMMSAQTDRHEKWIKQIAEKMGVKLEY